MTAALSTVHDAIAAIDIAATVGRAEALVAAGVTDLRLALELTRDGSAAADVLCEVVGAFRAAVGRTDLLIA